MFYGRDRVGTEDTLDFGTPLKSGYERVRQDRCVRVDHAHGAARM